MASDVYSKLLTAPVVDNGTIVFPYKAGRDADDYSSLGHGLYASALQANFPIASDGIGVVFGETDITITYKGATTIPANSKVSFNGVLEDAQTEFGDFTVDDLAVGGAVTSPALLTETDVGTVTTEATTVVEEHGDGVDHLTKLTLTDFDIGDVGDTASLAIGAKFYTLPAGGVFVENISLDGTITCAGTGYEADTPEIGIGTVVGSGAVATLGDVGAAAENAWGPVVAGALDDIAIGAIKASALYVATSGGLAHDLFLNAADAWANGTAGALLFTGVITIRWRKIT